MKLYKYMPYREDFFEKRLLKFTPPCFFNDPFEGRVKTSSIILDRKIMVNKEGSWVALTKDEIGKKTRLMGQESLLVGVLSLSRSKYSLLMWAHYANNHEGVIVEFDTDHPFFNQTIHPNEKYHSNDSPINFKNSKIDYSLLGKVFPVNYESVRPENTIPGLETELNSLFYKSDEWIYEKEYRMLMMLADGSVMRRNNHYETFSLFEVPCDAISKIIIGCRAHKIKIVDNFKIALEKNPDLSHIKLEIAQIHLEYYHLEYIPIKLNDVIDIQLLL